MSEKDGFPRRGVTLFETILLLAVLGILSVVGFSTFQAYRQSVGLAAAEQEITELILRGRWMAINSGRPRIVDLGSPDVVRVRDGEGTVLASLDLSSYAVTQVSSASSVTFDSRGLVTPAAAVTITLTNTLSEDRTVRVTPLGRVEPS